MMDVRPIRTEQDFDEAIRRIETLWDARPGTKEGDLLDILVDLAWAYEERTFLRRQGEAWN